VTVLFQKFLHFASMIANVTSKIDKEEKNLENAQHISLPIPESDTALQQQVRRGQVPHV